MKLQTFTKISPFCLVASITTDMIFLAAPHSIGKVGAFSARHFRTIRSRPFPTNVDATSSKDSRLYGGASRRARSTDTTVPPSSSTNELDFEGSFEFGDSPKWDKRFDGSSSNNHSHNKSDPQPPKESQNLLTKLVASASTEEEFQQLIQDEQQQDVKTVHTMDRNLAAWQQLDPDTIHRATALLEPYVTPERRLRMQTVLSQRTQHTRFLFENPSNPSNVWACLRTMDAFGIQHVDVVIDSGKYVGKAAISQKRGMRTAMGSAQWLTLRNHASTVDAIRHLRETTNCIIYASDLNPKAVDIRSIDWDTEATSGASSSSSLLDISDSSKGDKDADTESAGPRPICIVMGNEEIGISDEMRELADVCFTLPMVGFAESFNLSVATAITLAHLSAASSSQSPESDGDDGCKGPLRPGDLPQHQYDCLYLKGLINSVAQRRVVDALLRKADIVLPKEMRLV